MTMRMHEGQVDLDEATVARLIAAQFPQWRALPIRRAASSGTVNALFRLGDELVLRFPLVPSDAAEQSLRAEQELCRLVAPQVRVSVPEPVAVGRPGEDFASAWAVYRWIVGDVAEPGQLTHERALAAELADFVRSVRAIDTAGRSWDGRSRGGPLLGYDEQVRSAVVASRELVDSDAVLAAWEQALAAPAHDGPGVWLHADLMPGNLLLRKGHLVGVLDFEAMCVGDPAADLFSSWILFSPAGRAAYREALGADDATWDRGRGWAIVQAIIALPYYVDTNPAMAGFARRALANVIA